MIDKIPPPLQGQLIPELTRIHNGKVRETYDIPGHDALQLVVATDRISAFDFVFNALVPDKGSMLTLMNIFFTRRVLTRFPTDIHLFGRSIEKVLPGLPKDILLRSTVVQKARMIPVEAIVRGYLTGSGLASYRKDGTVCGHQLPPDLKDGSKLPTPLFTPTTKAEAGHDEHLNADDVRETKHGAAIEQLAMAAYDSGAEYARSKGLILADTKFEFGLIDGELALCDEKLTPDSSRYWTEADRLLALDENRAPKSHDKESFREYARQFGINKLDPEKPEDIARVHALVIPEEIIERTSRIYLETAETLMGMHFREAQKEYLGL